MAERKREPETVIRVRIIHVGSTDSGGLPTPERIEWPGGITEIVHVAGGAL
ncbi:MAG: hypothetical protein ACRD4X_18670 [Candidatus Acidiferrales bacterium]